MSVESSLRNAIFRMIENQRNGESIEISLLKTVINSYGMLRLEFSLVTLK